jgi:hypothetical protein
MSQTRQFAAINVAARLEGIAEPGGICISEDALRQVRGKLDAEFADIGEPHFSLTWMNENAPFVGEMAERLLEGLRRTGAPER